MMPHIESQEQRDALIAECKWVIRNLKKCLELGVGESAGKELRSAILIHEITLAALEAKSVGVVAHGETSALVAEYHGEVSVGDDLYTAPPVPALKPVALPRSITHITNKPYEEARDEIISFLEGEGFTFTDCDD